MSSNHERALEALGARLRELRRASGLNGRQFAAKLGWYGASRISKLELGQQMPSDQDLVEWTTACNAPEALDELRIKLSAVETLYTEWRRQLYAGIHTQQRDILELESEANQFREFVTALIPGMLQTPDYAVYLFTRFASHNRVPPTIDEAVRLRMQRQEALYAQNKHYRFVLTEAVLRYTMVPHDVMVAHDARHGFWIIDDRLVIVETYATELRLTEQSDIALYGRVFDRMAKNAVHGDEARRQISHVARTLPPPADS